MEYDKLQIATIFSSCKKMQEVVECNKIFFWLKLEWGKNHDDDVFTYGAKRARILKNGG